VTLLRGVNNIGATRRVAMADLRTLFEGLGFRDVRTLLNSGNVVFAAPKAAGGEVQARIEKGLATIGLTSPVILLSGAEVAAAIRRNPLSRLATNPSQCLVVVPPTRSRLARLRPLLGRRWAPEVLALGPRVAYLWCARGVARSPLWAAVDRALERTGTVRNLATMSKLMALSEE
jgi:uncharacterized protein (DUF1697 family)